MRGRLADLRPIVLFRLPVDLGEALAKQPHLSLYWQRLNKHAQQSYIRFLMAARSAQTRHQRLMLILKLVGDSYRLAHGLPT